jgi:hypothetical protein
MRAGEGAMTRDRGHKAPPSQEKPHTPMPQSLLTRSMHSARLIAVLPTLKKGFISLAKGGEPRSRS